RKNSEFSPVESLHMMRPPNQSFYSKLISFSSPAILLESQSSSISVDTPPNSHVVLAKSRVPDTKSHSKTRRDKYAILPTITTPLNRLEFEMLHRFPSKLTFAGTSFTARTTNTVKIKTLKKNRQFH